MNFLVIINLDLLKFTLNVNLTNVKALQTNSNRKFSIEVSISASTSDLLQKDNVSSINGSQNKTSSSIPNTEVNNTFGDNQNIDL